MPYLWVDDPIAFASGREVYGFAKTQGWMPRLGDPRGERGRDGRRILPSRWCSTSTAPPSTAPGSELSASGCSRSAAGRLRRGGPADGGPAAPAEGDDLASLVGHFIVGARSDRRSSSRRAASA